ncbi:MAG: hypothetical protein DSY87_07785 [Methylococcus sp.]|nr:MAG: hypothetical protein DSY87_07785 [Methylococcus sp.]
MDGLMEILGLPADPATAATYVWVFALALGLVVSLVVTLLLWMIHREAGIINARVSRIWDAGQRVANNTIHIPTLYRINDGVDQILATALRINDGAEAIETHANGCPGCPHCMLEH